jgi:serine protease Do
MLSAREPLKVTVADRAVNRAAPGTSYASVVKRVTPSVVTISSTRTRKMPDVPEFLHPFLQDPRLRRFFGEDADPGRQRPRKHLEQSLGSGVIISEDGYILTNNHVIEGADADGVKITLSDGNSQYDATVIGADPQTDIAILKIEAKKLPAIVLGDSDNLEVGDVVLAIGNPFGIGQSVSMGIISALGRGFGILGQDGYENFIQTDSAINRGNSGGALVDAEGRLIGINQSIASPSGASAGVGFAVPVNLAHQVAKRLVADGKITRGYLGVNLQPLTGELAEDFKLPNSQGALIGGVMPETPADKAGMAAGDVIVEFNGKKVSDSRQLRLMVAQTPPKTTVTFKALRDGREKSFTVTLAELPGDTAGGSGDEPEDSRAGGKARALDGVEIEDLDADWRQQHDIPQRIRGALVADVEPDSRAGEAGLRPGDVIVEINRRPVHDADDAARLIRESKGARILLRVFSQSGGRSGTRYLTVETSGKKK